MRIIRNEQPCYGCRACGMICAFHKNGAFSPGGGAIVVKKDPRTGAIGWRIDSTCDACAGEGHPLCVRYCTYRALTAKG